MKKIVTVGRIADIDTRKARGCGDRGKAWTRKAWGAEIEVKVQARKARGYGDRGSGIGSTGSEYGDRC